MKTRLLIAMFFVIVSCKQTPKIKHTECFLETIEHVAAAGGFEVKYSITGEGDFTVNSWYYMDNDGKVELSNPTVPAEITVFIEEGKSFHSGAVGSVTTGLIRIEFEVISDETMISGVDQCVQSLAQ